MKYKHIAGAIHNFGHSFTSLMNYVDGDYVIDELAKIHAEGKDIEVDWLSGRFKPAEMAFQLRQPDSADTGDVIKGDPVFNIRVQGSLILAQG